MLFRPVFGPELEAIFTFVTTRSTPAAREDIYQIFLPEPRNDRKVSTQNVDDALTFLVSANLLTNSNGFTARSMENFPSFRLLLLHQLRGLAKGGVVAKHKFDPLYLLLLDELFIKPDRLFVANVHAAANGLREVTSAGGLSWEKIRSWTRVMAFLGIGHRVGKGFQCVYAPDLLHEIIEMWQEEGVIQAFLEDHATHYLPFHTETGTLTVAAEESFLSLTTRGVLILTARQDASSKPYFGEQRLRYLSRVNHRREASG